MKAVVCRSDFIAFGMREPLLDEFRMPALFIQTRRDQRPESMPTSFHHRYSPSDAVRR
jgi:hypothetical protein